MTHASRSRFSSRSRRKRIIQAIMALVTLSAFSFILYSKFTGVYAGLRDEAFGVMVGNAIALLLTLLIDGSVMLRAASLIFRYAALIIYFGSKVLDRIAGLFDRLYEKVFGGHGKKDTAAHQNADPGPVQRPGNTEPVRVQAMRIKSDTLKSGVPPRNGKRYRHRKSRR